MRSEGELPFYGEVVWLTADQGGRESGPPATPDGHDYAATAFVPPARLDDGLASFVLRVADRAAWRSHAQAGWLIVDNEGHQRVESGSVVVLTEGTRAVAYFHAQVVDEA